MKNYFPLPNPCMIGAKVFLVRDSNGFAFYELTAGTSAEAFADARKRFGRRAKSVVIKNFVAPSLAYAY